MTDHLREYTQDKLKNQNHYTKTAVSKAIEMKDQAKILTLTEFVEQYGDTHIAMWFACNDSKTIDMAGTDALPNYDYQGHVSTK